ncbi:enoyl-CoA hydratase/isomerase family protein [Pseudomonas sp. N040]|uniref:enoyl-CoA hydratase/isomerase family protein n=1 Tax=Pseudomonas sp. N040 TaxID=2785325 RepID=UPI0018A24B4E|nr:enoyl-CoA hydratase/isomerase family protein [Pseudomonas sp. N040]MBF7729398.1 enoyl-CoA hydratase/isomerase family protein [Pseudomonas sp. N040]MBW7013038.1 enoyl-CoA hydratase/isomerase family protein [Pseudomonas sp. N040]
MHTWIRQRREGSVLWLELEHPPVNFLTVDICAELYQCFRSAEQDAGIRSIVLGGGLTDCYIFHFSIPELQCIGVDNRRLGLDRLVQSALGARLLKSSAALSLWLMERSSWFAARLLGLARRLRSRSSTLYMWLQMMAAYKAIEQSSKVTIAAINGTCNGGGTEMAACFDFRFMVEDGGFTIGQPEVLIGIIAGGGGSQRWPRLLGKARALEFMLLCEQWTPQQAKQAGVITDHFGKAEFHSRVQAFAERFGQRSAVAVAENKQAVRRGLECGLNQALAIEMVSSLRCCSDPSTQQVLAEYAEILQQQVIQAETPASIPALMQAVQATSITRHFSQQENPQ